MPYLEANTNLRVVDTEQIFKIIRLQKRVKKFVQNKRAAELYLETCSSLPEANDARTELAQEALRKYGPFVYSNEVDELEMNFGSREIRPMTLN